MEYVAEEVGEQLAELQAALDAIKAKHGELINVMWRESYRTYVVVYEYDPSFKAGNK